MGYRSKIVKVQNITHDVKSFLIEKPLHYSFQPGQATEVSINKHGWEAEKRPFTFTSLNESPLLEFIVKIYSDHQGVTNELSNLKIGDELLIGDVWGAVEYKDPGYFIAGGSGITPFIAILRQLKKDNKVADNKLFFSNKRHTDIILKDELQSILGENALFTLTRDSGHDYDERRIDELFIKKEIIDFSKNFYVCGPSKMVEDINSVLLKFGVSPSEIILER